MTFYIDLILLENIIMNYIIILTTGIICKAEIKQMRIGIASSLGAFYVIMLYLLALRIYNNQIIKIFVSICMIYIAFRPKNLKILLKQFVIFYLTSFCFGGAAYYLLYGINPNLIKNINGILVGTYPMKIAILGGILGFFIMNLSFGLIKNKLTKKDMFYQIDIVYQQQKSSIKAILDTGNLLTDPITKVPVLIVEAQKLNHILPQEILDNPDKVLSNNAFDHLEEAFKTRCSMIPFSSIGKNNGMIIGFRPDYIKIDTPEGEEVRRKVIIGIYNHKIAKNGVYSGLMGLNLLNEEIKVGDNHEDHSITKI